MSVSLSTAGPDRHNAIGALRIALAGMVVYTHACLLGGFGSDAIAIFTHDTTTAGTIGVQCFFVLSGWLVATSWRRQPSLPRFLWHRFLRLAPAFWICLIVTAFVFTPLLHLTSGGSMAGFFALDPSPAGYVWRNLLLPRSQIAVGPFPNGGPWGVDWNGALWTLFYEGACYLMIAALGLIGVLTRWRTVGTAAIVALLGIHVAYAAGSPHSLPALLARLCDTPGKVLSLHFLAGAIWAMWPQHAQAALRRPWVALVAAVTLLMSWRLGFHVWFTPLALPPALLWLAHHGPLVDFETKAGGDYSYGLYIYGYPVQQIMAHFQVHQHGFTIFFAAGLIVALSFAVASWRLIEKPSLSLKSLGGRQHLPLAASPITAP
jgi:peptidoglycan/LPS O-acetylase OafA/YrhL